MSGTSLDRQLEEFARHLDTLAARATRTVADLRQTCQTILDDVAAFKQHVDFAPVDAELARMEASDHLSTLEHEFETKIARVLQRVENARDESIAALLRLHDGVDGAARDVARRAGIFYGASR
jgi:hypothetical protein